jgi:hypothetical protein
MFDDDANRAPLGHRTRVDSGAPATEKKVEEQWRSGCC